MPTKNERTAPTLLHSFNYRQDGHELSYAIVCIISSFSVSVNGKFSVTDRIPPCDFPPVCYNEITKQTNQVMRMKQMLFILNPKAGTKKANRVLADILNIFNRADFAVQVYITAGPQDATLAIKTFGQGKDLIVCCGGDGTLNEVITGMLDAGLDIPLGYIPAGSTNDFANSLHMPSDPLAAAEQIAKGSPQQLDVGQFGDRYFSYVASFGAFTKASYATPQNIKNALGHTAYLLEGISELSLIRKLHLRLELDGDTIEDDFLFGAICNSTSLGGILTLDPNQVDMADGMFEVLLVRAPRDLAEITECILAVQKQQYNCRMVTFRSAKNIRISTENELCWTLDGEKGPCSDSFSVTNLHHAIKLIR